MDILSVYLNNISLDNINFDENDPKTIIRVAYISWRNRFKQGTIRCLMNRGDAYFSDPPRAY